jgi:Lrp/AsnC family leucine-responsive transcriptional regulator
MSAVRALWPNLHHRKGYLMENDPNAGPLDGFDRKLLTELSKNGRLPVTELARRIGLSKSPTQARLKRLEAQGYILGYRALLDPEKLDRDHVAFVEVRLTDTREAALAAFNAAVIAVPEIETCHLIAGQFDYLLKIRVRDMRAYRDILAEVVSELPHVSSTSTHVSMQAVKDAAL